MFHLLADLHDWDPEQIKYLTLAQALIYVKNPEKTSLGSVFRKSVKFRNRAEALEYLESR